jgi:hypothetical protein
MIKLKDLEQFCYNLLCKRKRRILILTRWHLNKNVNGDTVDEVISNFFNLLLYSPISLSLHSDHIRLFNSPNLKIYLNWLDKFEREFIAKLYINRLDVFEVNEVFKSGLFSCRNCKFNSNTMWPIENRREMLRDFVWLMLQNKSLEHFAKYLFLAICQKLQLEKKDQTDRFVYELYNALQGREKLENIQCFY